ncbi:MAG: histidine phosphatase family protein [Clostridiales bacterium]|nr:histidine phosphatase family protein [Clostridiales bacterium]
MSDKITPVVELELYLVRHGESYGNVPRDTPGRLPEDDADPRLTPDGELQARLLGEHFSRVTLDCVMSSGLRRAMSTARAVTENQSAGGAHEVEIYPILSESGTCSEQAYKTPEQLKALLPCAVCPQSDFSLDMSCEDDAARLFRANEFIAGLRRRFKSGEKVLVAAHACFNTFIYFAALGLDSNQPFDADFYNTGVTKFIFYAKGTGLYGADTVVAYHNDHSHLHTQFPMLGFNI